MIGLECVLGERGLESLVAAQRIAETQRLGELSGLVNELVHPYQIDRALGMCESGEQWP